jgi:PAS domain S-box-containing protein
LPKGPDKAGVDLTGALQLELLHAAPDPTVIVDEQGRIVFASARVRDVLGYDPPTLIGLPVETLLPQRFRGGHHAHRRDYMEDPSPRPMGSTLDLYALHKDGGEIPVEISLSPVVTDQGVLVSSTMRDISERRQMEALLARERVALGLAGEVAERANASKSRFLAAASHDLRQPLQSLGLYLSVLARQLEAPTPLEICSKMRASLDTMGELLDALLDISRLDSGSVVPEKKHFPIKPLFDRIVTGNVQQAEEKGLLLECESSACVVDSDPGLLERVVENLVTNAIRYTEAGSVSLRCERVDGVARISVSDTGVGIPEESLGKIFDEYYQLDNPVRDRRKGLGLGLSIVKHIARLLDHELHVSSVAGRGSIFAVDVPVAEISVEEARAPASAPRQQRRDPVVLFVEDDSAVIDATTMLFDCSGIALHTATDGHAAIDLVNGGVVPDLILSDYRLPGMNGVEVARRVRELLGTQVPVVLMTGDTSAREIEGANLPDCTVLHKPVDTDQLLMLVEGSLSLSGEDADAAASGE